MSSTSNPAQRAGSAVIAVLVVVVVAVAALMVAPNLAPRANNEEMSSVESLSPVTATGEVTEVEVSVQGMSFVPGTIEVPAGNSLVIKFHNTGDQRHDLAFPNGAATPTVAPGETATLAVGVVSGDMEGWCTLPGHRQMGMVLSIVATGDGASEDEGNGLDPHADHGGGALLGMEALIAQAGEVAPYPAELPALTDDTLHEYTFEVTESEEELAEGLVRAVWTYNETAPGPVLHGRVGDTFRITLVNKGTMGHSIDFHAGVVAPDEPMRTSEPGESLVYEFVAPRSGIWMYHCSTMPMATHIAQGMFGAVVIEPDELPAVDHQYVLIQSDIYLDDAFAEGDLVPDYTAFNGRPFQYDAHPLTAAVGDRVRIWVLDVGPNSALSFHVVGTQFDTVWSEGGYSVYQGTSTDGVTRGETGAQVLPLLAAQGGFVEFMPVEAGTYTFVNHIMSLAERGAHGILKVSE